jgi:hypothetical protein
MSESTLLASLFGRLQRRERESGTARPKIFNGLNLNLWRGENETEG